ncbi:hypothetical protein TRFO_10100 [Tritrichomonas foetus]|uniref:Uncharacterized protein n=1 Tax=Tritrichomonas foetus TaxID=1144522 RepID=A0A1J4JFE9_9EUKA|nr:hypothetical protein TRFO_10100 [Tritrichomonas foetus]|eukprot:OHS96181.1 hypothetical protein TRFO_10100 [Tritrichomonas foetus]
MVFNILFIFYFSFQNHQSHFLSYPQKIEYDYPIDYIQIFQYYHKNLHHFFSWIMLNLSLVSLIISSGSHSPLFAHTARYSSASSYSTLSLTRCLFTRQFSPIVFTKDGAPLNLNVIDSEFARFLDSAIQLNSAFGNWIDQDRTTDCSTDDNCRPIITCPHAQLINTKFHDFSSDRLVGSAFGAQHNTQVTIDRCSFWNVYCTQDNGAGILFTNVEKPVSMTATCFSECSTNLASKKGRIHTFDLLTKDALTISQCSVFKCGEGQSLDVAVCGGGKAMNIEKFNSSYNTLSDGGAALTITHKAISSFKMQFLHFQDCGEFNTQFKIGPEDDLTNNAATFSIENSNFINLKSDSFFELGASTTKKISYSYSLANCVLTLHDSFAGQSHYCPIYASSKNNVKVLSVTNCVSNCEWKNQADQKPAGWKVEANPKPLKIEGLLGTGNTCNPNVIPVPPVETPEQPNPDPPVETPDKPNPDPPVETPDKPNPDPPVETPDKPNPDPPVESSDKPNPDPPEQKTPNPDESPDKPKTADPGDESAIVPTDENENTGTDDDSQVNGGGSKLSGGAIAGIVIGVLVVVGIVIGAVVFLKIRKAAKVSSSAGNVEV